jgi:hypothetical protein
MASVSLTASILARRAIEVNRPYPASRVPQVAAVHLNRPSIVLAELDPQWQMADTAREKIAVPLRAFAKDTAATNRRENSKSKMPQVYAGEIHS